MWIAITALSENFTNLLFGERARHSCHQLRDRDQTSINIFPSALHQYGACRIQTILLRPRYPTELGLISIPIIHMACRWRSSFYTMKGDASWQELNRITPLLRCHIHIIQSGEVMLSPCVPQVSWRYDQKYKKILFHTQFDNLPSMLPPSPVVFQFHMSGWWGVEDMLIV